MEPGRPCRYLMASVWVLMAPRPRYLTCPDKPFPLPGSVGKGAGPAAGGGRERLQAEELPGCLSECSEDTSDCPPPCWRGQPAPSHGGKAETEGGSAHSVRLPLVPLVPESSQDPAAPNA